MNVKESLENDIRYWSNRLKYPDLDSERRETILERLNNLEQALVDFEQDQADNEV